MSAQNAAFSREDITLKVKQIIAENRGIENRDEIKLESKIGEHLGADSIDQVEIVMSIETEFDILIPDEEAEKIETVGQIIDFICASKEAATAE